MQQKRPHHQVLVEDLRRPLLVRRDPTDQSGEMEQDVRPRILVQENDIVLARQVVLRAADDERVAPFFAQRLHHVGADEAGAAGDGYPLARPVRHSTPLPLPPVSDCSTRWQMTCPMAIWASWMRCVLLLGTRMAISTASASGLPFSPVSPTVLTARRGAAVPAEHQFPAALQTVGDEGRCGQDRIAAVLRDELLHGGGLRQLRTYLLQPSSPVHGAVTSGCCDSC